MNKQFYQTSEQQAALAFSQQAAVFDGLYAGNSIVQYKRKRVRDHLMQRLGPGSHILELNAGTGDDAIFFAKNGYYVHATDIAAGMQEKLQEKVLANGLTDYISNEQCSYTALAQLITKVRLIAFFQILQG